MIWYLLLALASCLFAVQFLFQQQYQKINGNSLNASLVFIGTTNTIALLLFFCINRFSYTFSLPSLFIGLFTAVSNTLYVFLGNKAMGKVSLTVYSMFAMLGGMAVPSAVGILFFHESLTLMRILCFLAICLALFLTVDRKGFTKATLLYSLGVFFLNGLSGVYAKIHQVLDGGTDNTSFSMTTTGVTLLVCFAVQLIRTHKISFPKGKAALFAGGYAALNGIGNLFLLFSLQHLEKASVQYPIVTGGTMVFSALIGLAQKEKFSLLKTVSVALALAASVLIMLENVV